MQGGLIDDGDRYNSASVGACAVTGEAVGLFLATVGSEALFHISFKDRQKYEIARIERWFAWDLDSAIYGRLLDVAVSPDGHLYVLTSNTDGRSQLRLGDDKILRIRFAEK